MKPTITLFAALLLLVWGASAQDRQGPPRGGRKAGGPGNAPEIGVVYGRVLDDATGDAMEFVTVSLEHLRDSSSVYGTITGRKGYFKIEKIKVGPYRVRFNYMGYAEQTVAQLRLSPRESVEADLGEIRMQSSISELGVAEVVDEKRFMEVQMDKKVYNVAENITTTGGSANEVLENIPSVEVDIDGQISLRGSSNVTVLIDGKPSGLTGGDREALLDQIPANLIDQVEVITNPSAKYDPDGMAGIINVVLKKNKLEGFYGNTQLSVGTGDNYDGSLGLNWRNSKVNLSSSYSYRYNDRFSRSTTVRDNFLETDTNRLDQFADGGRLGTSHTVRLGADWYLTPARTLSVSGNLGLRNQDNHEVVDFRILAPENVLEEHYDRSTSGINNRGSFDLNVGYREEFGSRAHFFKADAFYSRFFGENTSTFIQRWYDLDGAIQDTLVPSEINTADNFTDVYTFQADYERPLENEGRFETGVKSIIRTMGTDFVAGFEDQEGNFENDLTRSNNFEFDEQIHSAYATWGRKFGDWGLQAGGRLEQALTTSRLVTTGETFENNYLSFFPSANLSYDLSEENILQFSYSRRINRPRTRQLNPFPNYTDPLNLRQGNPFLLPEYTHSVEFGWTKYIKRNTFSSAVYYRDVSNVIRRFKRVDDNGVSTTTFENIAGTQSYGLELIAAFRLGQAWSLNGSANFYRTVSDGSNLESDLNADAFGWFARLRTSYKWGDNWEAQVSGFYRAPMIILQGEFSGILSSDVAVQKRIWDGKGTIGLRLRDALDTREFEFITEGSTFYQEGYRKRESQNVFLTFSYRFGKLEERSGRRGRGSSGFGGDDGGGMEID